MDPRFYRSLIALSACLPFTASAEQLAPPDWQIVPEKSRIIWQATQNDAPVKGEFTEFYAHTLRFHPKALPESKAIIAVKTGSITTSYDEAEDTLKKPGWFAVEEYPRATFETTAFKTGPTDQQFLAEATLTIKGHTVPLTLDFSLHHFDDNQARMSGEVTINRTDFAIGWKETKQVKDPVKVTVEITATR